MTDSEELQLDMYFREDARAIFSMLFLVPKTLRFIARVWFAVFYQMGGNFLDKQMRNQYAAHMLMQLEINRELSAPFDEAPPGHLDTQVAKVIGTDEYMKFFRKCETYYRLKKSTQGETQTEELRIQPAEFLYSSPPINTGVVAYGACFSKDTQ
ncbi:uncharacterized protein LOC131683459 [Topomyia yanbarensis]|uniref:uncharacterized protein LOC131683459 n=1 Tax=Topomyia yanbarensis TaxID=2498891 RepID=UPI00273AA25C|nr:uncharacterized protein LOC131683459 [Topomyia yanbarensis]